MAELRADQTEIRENVSIDQTSGCKLLARSGFRASPTRSPRFYSSPATKACRCMLSGWGGAGRHPGRLDDPGQPGRRLSVRPSPVQTPQTTWATARNASAAPRSEAGGVSSFWTGGDAGVCGVRTVTTMLPVPSPIHFRVSKV